MIVVEAGPVPGGVTSISQKLAGIGVSDGFAFGRAHFVDRRALPVPQTYIPPDDVDAEVERYLEAQAISKTQLEALKLQMKNAGEEHYLILDTHLLMTSDSMLTDGLAMSWCSMRMMNYLCSLLPL